jgi:hypothetical protein
MDDRNDPPLEKEYIVENTLEPYIDRKDLENLLYRIFRKKITVYVSRYHNILNRKYLRGLNDSVCSTTMMCSGIQPRDS